MKFTLATVFCRFEKVFQCALVVSAAQVNLPALRIAAMSLTDSVSQPRAPAPTVRVTVAF